MLKRINSHGLLKKLYPEGYEFKPMSEITPGDEVRKFNGVIRDVLITNIKQFDDNYVLKIVDNIYRTEETAILSSKTELLVAPTYKKVN